MPRDKNVSNESAKEETTFQEPPVAVADWKALAGSLNANTDGVAMVITEAAEDAKPTAPPNVVAMNVSATLLHLDNGEPFAPRATAQLTPAEVERFSKFNLISIKS